MKTLINRQILIKKITANQKKHARIYASALVGYRQKLIHKCRQNLARALKKQPVNAAIGLVEPVQNLDEYAKVLAMLNLSVEENVLLDETDIDRYVMDNWDWKERFMTSNSFYSKLK